MGDYRKIYESTNNCCLLPGVHIHHLDLNHSNDNPANLMALSSSEHMAQHHKDDPRYIVQIISLGKSNHEWGVILGNKNKDTVNYMSNLGKLGGIASRESGQLARATNIASLVNQGNSYNSKYTTFISDYCSLGYTMSEARAAWHNSKLTREMA